MYLATSSSRIPGFACPSACNGRNRYWTSPPSRADVATAFRQLWGAIGLLTGREKPSGLGRWSGNTICSGTFARQCSFLSRGWWFCYWRDVLLIWVLAEPIFRAGDFDTLVNSIQTQFLPCRMKPKSFSGHGPVTTVGFERWITRLWRCIKMSILTVLMLIIFAATWHLFYFWQRTEHNLFRYNTWKMLFKPFSIREPGAWTWMAFI